jgi:hypothetical protein
MRASIRKQRAPSRSPTGSCGNCEDFVEPWSFLPVLNLVGKGSKNQPLNLGNRLRLRLAVDHGTGQSRHFRNPPSVRLLFHPNAHSGQIFALAKSASAISKWLWPQVRTVADKTGAKIRRAELDKVTYALIVGEKEAEAKEVSVRSRFTGEEGKMPFDTFLARVREEINSRKLLLRK